MKYLSILLAVVFLAPAAHAKPPQAPPLIEDVSSWTVTEKITAPFPPCGIPGCGCGCTQGRDCVCDHAGKNVVNELDRPYAKEWQAQGYTWHPDKGYWTGPPVITAPACENGQCIPARQPFQMMPQMIYQPAQMPMSFGGGMMRGGGGRSGGC